VKALPRTHTQNTTLWHLSPMLHNSWWRGYEDVDWTGFTGGTLCHGDVPWGSKTSGNCV